MPGVWDPLSARLAARAGFERCSCRATRGRHAARASPTSASLTQTEMADVARRVCPSVPDTMVVVDADTGYGNAAQHAADRRALGGGRRRRPVPRGPGLAQAVRPHGRQAGRRPRTSGWPSCRPRSTAARHLHITARTDARGAARPRRGASSGPGRPSTSGSTRCSSRRPSRSPSSSRSPPRCPASRWWPTWSRRARPRCSRRPSCTSSGFDLIVSPLSGLFAATQALGDGLRAPGRGRHPARRPRPAGRLRRVHRPRRACPTPRPSTPATTADLARPVGPRLTGGASGRLSLSTTSGVARVDRVRQPGTDTQGAIPLRRSSRPEVGMWSEPMRLRSVEATKCPGAPPATGRRVLPAADRRRQRRDHDGRPHDRTRRPDRASAARAPTRCRPRGAWRPGDPVGRRRFVSIGRRPAASCSRAAACCATSRVAYETWGELDADASNAVLVCHALTGDAHAAGPSGPGHPTAGLVGRADRAGPGARHRPLLRRVRQRARRLPGHDRAGVDRSRRPAGRTARRFPVVTIRDMVRTQAAVADHLGIDRWLAVVGGSMGGMQVLEWGGDVPRAGAVARRHRHHARRPRAQQIAWSVDRRARRSRSTRSGAAATTTTPRPATVRTRAWRWPARSPRSPTAPTRCSTSGSGAARLDPLDDRFTLWQRFDVEGYLDYHGAKLVRRFDANSYLRDQPGHGPARPRPRPRRRRPRRCAGSRAPCADRQHRLRRPVPALPAGAAPRRCSPRRAPACEYVVIDSPDGHDGFLLETDQVGAAARRVPRRRGEAPMTDDRDRPADAGRRPQPALHPETTRHPGRAGRQRHRAGADPVGDHHVRDADGRRGPAHGHDGRAPPLLQPLRQPDGRRLRGGHRRARGGRERPGPSRRAWARSARSCSACARRATTSSPSASSTPAPSCCCRRRARASASTSPSSTAPSPARSPRRSGPGKTMLVLAETPANPRLDLVDLDELGAIAGPDHRGRLDLRHAARASARSTTASTWSSTRPPRRIAGHNDATLGVVAGSDELVDWLWSFAVLQGANASPFDAMNGLRGLRTLGVRLRQQTETRAAAGRGARGATRGRARCATRASTRIPQRDLAKRQMALTGGLLTFDLAGGLEAGRTLRRGRRGSPSWPPRSAGPRRW